VKRRRDLAPRWRAPAIPDLPAAPETVVLVHGQGRTRASMALLARRLRRAGYGTLLFGYSVRAAGLDGIATGLLRAIKRGVATPVYHLVGHSLGNVIARHAFRWGYPAGLGRMVMLAPPNAPADLARRWQGRPLFRRLTGDAGQRLADPGFYESLPVPPVPFGVIAGDRDHTGLLREVSDGVVTVAGTRLPGLADWIALHRTHTFLMHAADTGREVTVFLRTGRFAK